jgi:hypothetical protein
MTEKCKDRVEENFKDRMEQLKQGELEVLSIDEKVSWDDGKPSYKRIQISWGGPSDEFRIYANGTIEYWFLDWYDGAKVVLNETEKEEVMERWPN